MTTILLLPDSSEFQWPPNHSPGTDMAGIKRLNGGAAIIRACYGLSHNDPAFRATRVAALDEGFSFLGIYQYIRADEDVLDQANYLLNLAGKLASHEIFIADLEEGTGSQYARALTWLAQVAERSGKEPLLYSDTAFAEEHGLAPIFNGPAVHTWVASYGSIEPALGHTLWQSTDGAVGSYKTNWPGAGFCDTSVFHGTLADLAAIVAPKTPAPVPVPTPAPKTKTEPEMILIQPDKTQVPAGTPWPGVYLLLSDGSMSHVTATVDGVNNVEAYQKAGVQGPADLTWDEFEGLLNLHQLAVAWAGTTENPGAADPQVTVTPPEALAPAAETEATP